MDAVKLFNFKDEQKTIDISQVKDWQSKLGIIKREAEKKFNQAETVEDKCFNRYLLFILQNLQLAISGKINVDIIHEFAWKMLRDSGVETPLHMEFFPKAWIKAYELTEEMKN